MSLSPKQALPAERLLAIIELQRAIVAAPINPEMVMKAVVERALPLTGADGAVIELIVGDSLVYRAAAGVGEKQMGLRIPIAKSLAGECVRTNTAFRCDDCADDPRVDRAACARVGLASMVCVPLAHDSKPLGVLKILSTRANAFTDADVETLMLLAGTIAAAMRHAEAFEELAYESTHCSLTGLFNRRAFDDRLQRELALSKTLCLALCDLDGFKLVNDRFGHAVGDALLKQVATVFESTLRGTDLAFRFGGDEFAVVLPCTSLPAARLAMERCVARVATLTVAGATVGMSVGVVESMGETRDALLRRADSLLYENKVARRASRQVA